MVDLRENLYVEGKIRFPLLNKQTNRQTYLLYSPESDILCVHGIEFRPSYTPQFLFSLGWHANGEPAIFKIVL